jgi:anti-sigma factor RsiW
MACSMNEHLVAYLDGELAGSLRDEVAQHIARCPECARELKELEVVRGLLARWPVREPGAQERARAWQRLQGARVAPARQGAGWLRPLVRYALPAAAAMMLVVVLTISRERRAVDTGVPEEMIAQLPVLEDMDMLEVYDVLTEWENLEALTALEEAPMNEEGTRQ